MHESVIVERLAGVKCSRDMRSPEQAAVREDGKQVEDNQDGDYTRGDDPPTKTRVIAAVPTSENDNWSKLWQRLDDIESRLSKVDVLEADITLLKSENEDMKKTVGLLEDKVEKCAGQFVAVEEFGLWKGKCVDLENRLRRNNVVIYNLPEGTEGKETGGYCTDYVQKFIYENMGFEVSVERAHRTPMSVSAEKLATAKRPRPIHVMFRHFMDKDRVIRNAATTFKGKVFDGRKIFVEHDLNEEIRSARKSKLTRFKELRKKGNRAFWKYPATIAWFNDDGIMNTE